MDDEERTPEQLWAAAYHEAGHAVVVFCLRASLGCVSILRDGSTLGQCDADLHGPAGSVGGVAGYLAGDVAEGRWSGREARDARDQGKAVELSRDACTNRLTRTPYSPLAAEYLARCRHLATEVIERHWPTVETFAQLLESERKLEAAVAKAHLGRLISEPCRDAHYRAVQTIVNWWSVQMEMRNREE